MTYGSYMETYIAMINCRKRGQCLLSLFPRYCNLDFVDSWGVQCTEEFRIHVSILYLCICVFVFVCHEKEMEKEDAEISPIPPIVPLLTILRFLCLYLCICVFVFVYHEKEREKEDGEISPIPPIVPLVTTQTRLLLAHQPVNPLRCTYYTKTILYCTYCHILDCMLLYYWVFSSVCKFRRNSLVNIVQRTVHGGGELGAMLV